MKDGGATTRCSVSVVIPVLNAASFLPELFQAIRSQKPSPPDEIILVDSISTDATVDLAKRIDGVRVVFLPHFSHGRARNLGAREAKGDLVVLMTQDAVPMGESWLAKLLEPLADPSVVATYSRQVPRPDVNPMERFFLETRFPPGKASVRREKKGDQPLTVEDVFFSNVSAAIRRDILLKFPFDEELIMSEDQQFSRDVIVAGYAVVYQPLSMVVHSHRYSLGVCFRRYFDSVYSLTRVFPAHRLGTSMSMGKSYLRQEIRYMATRYPLWLPYYFLYTLAKIAGTLAAHLTERLPLSLVRKMSLHRYHWNEENS